MLVTEGGGPFHGDNGAERTQTLQTLLRAGMVVLLVGAASALFRPGRVWDTAFPYVLMFAGHVIAYALSRTGRIRLAVTAHVTLYLAIVAFAMYRYGGVQSPAGYVLPPIVLLAGLTWNARAALVTVGAAVLLTVVVFWLGDRGMLAPARPPDPPRQAFVICAALVITGAILAVALRIIAKARVRVLEHERARQRIEERLIESRKLETVARTAAGVAHDFNNVLTVILATAGALKRNSDARVVSAADAIEEAATGAAKLTRLLLALGRKQELLPRVIQVRSAIHDAEPLLKRFAGESRLVVEVDPEIGAVRADPTQLQQVLFNLVGNAGDSMPVPGTVTLRASKAGSSDLARVPEWNPGPRGAVALEVIDTGTGMTREVQARLFEPFFTTKEIGKGTGLGLAVVHGIVAQSGGAIAVDSVVGRGSSFVVFLPSA